ncbi:hypothetical protein KC330_g62 [Hortaea werneckii]|nr:hypothetical protein KC330_g62 [Hortaea werneckii]
MLYSLLFFGGLLGIGSGPAKPCPPVPSPGTPGWGLGGAINRMPLLLFPALLVRRTVGRRLCELLYNRVGNASLQMLRATVALCRATKVFACRRYKSVPYDQTRKPFMTTRNLTHQCRPVSGTKHACAKACDDIHGDDMQMVVIDIPPKSTSCCNGIIRWAAIVVRTRSTGNSSSRAADEDLVKYYWLQKCYRNLK